MLRAVSVVRKPAVKSEHVAETLTLKAEERRVHHNVMQSDKGLSFVTDLAKEVLLQPGDALKLEDGKLVQIKAADEAVLILSADNPLRLLKAAWHFGSSHDALA